MDVDAKKVFPEGTPPTPSSGTAAASKPKRSHKRKPPGESLNVETVLPVSVRSALSARSTMGHVPR